MATIDSLDIKISAQANKASASLDNLSRKLGRVSASLSGVNTRGLATMGSGVNKLANAMNNFSRNTKTTDFTRLARNINALGNIDSAAISRAASSITKIANASKAFEKIKVSDSAKQFGNLAKGISQLGYGSATQAINNIPKLATAMKDLMGTLSKAPKVSQNIIDMTNALAKLARTGASSGRAANSLSKSLLSYSSSSARASKSSFSLASAIGKVYATYWLLFRAFGKLREAVNLASNLTEVQNVIDVTFGNMASKVEDFAKTSIEQFGMSELSLKQYASRFQAMGTAMGIDSSAVRSSNEFLNKQTNGYIGLSDSMADVSLNITKLAADMASFYNVEQADVADDLSAIFTGQTRPLRAYGLDLTQATLQEWAMKNGLDANIDSMSQAEKTMLRYRYVLANTGAAQGDFARTANTWANQIRILKQQFQQLGIVIGGTLINALKPLVNALNNAMGHIIAFAETVSNSLGKIFGWKFEKSGGGMANDMGDIADITESASDGAGDLSKNLGNAAKNAKKLKTITLGIDELNINDPDKDAPGGSGGSGSAGGGTGGGLGAGGVATGVFGKWVKDEESFFESEIDTLYKLGEYIGNALSNSLENINWDSVYEKARNFGTGLADFLNGLISPRLFYDLGKTIANSINTAFHAANAFAIDFDWKNLGESLASSIKGFFENWDAGLAAETFSNFCKGVIQAMTSFVTTLGEDETFKDIGQKLVDLICNFDWKGYAWNAYNFYRALAKALGEFPTDFAKGVAESILEKILGVEDVKIKTPKWFDNILRYITMPQIPGFQMLAFLPDSEEMEKGFEGIAIKFRGFYEKISGLFSRERWMALGENVRQSLENKFLLARANIEEKFSDIAKWFAQKYESVKQVFLGAPEYFGEKFGEAYAKVKESFQAIGTWFQGKWDAVKGIFKDVKEFFRSGFQSAYDAVKKIWSGLGDFFKGIAENAFKPIKKLVNGIISGVNWILEKVGSSTRFEKWDGIQFAKGSDGIPRNTIGMVNDQKGATYKELIVPPKGKPFIPEGRNVMLPLEKGTKIMPARQTRQLLENMPHFASGIGDFFGSAWEKLKSFTGDIWDYISEPGKIVQIAIDKFTDISGMMEPWLSVAGGVANKTFGAIKDYVAKIFGQLMPKIDYRPSAGVEQWRTLAAKALRITGQFSESNLAALLTQMQHESGGNPKAINNWDINAKRGTPSKGLMQVIDPTFRANALAPYNKDIYDPLSNMIASIRYTIKRYGSLYAGWTARGYKGYASGIGTIGIADLIPRYSTGGFPEDGLFYANHNELVGQFGDGRTAVANNNQITSGIEEAAYRGFMRAISEEPYLRQIAQNTRESADKDMSVKLDTRELKSGIDRRGGRNGYVFST